MSVAKRRERERQERRAQIVEAAATVFKSKGFSDATMGDIAAEAELSKGTLYLYFKSKDELFLAISNTKLTEVAARFEQIRARDSAGLDQLEAMFHAYADVALSDPEMFRIALVWITSGQKVDTETPAFCCHRDCVELVVRHMVEAIEDGRRDGSVRQDVEPFKLATQIWGGMLGTLLLQINAEEMSRRAPVGFDFEGQIPGFIGLLRRGLASAQEAKP